MKLEIELIPKSTHFTNVRSLVSKKRWDELRTNCYKNSNYKCEICFGKGKAHPVECHEIWNYDFKTKIQKLIRLISLCPSCHEVKHIGLATVRGRRDIVKAHFMKINNIDSNKAEEEINKAFKEWNIKNKINWKLNIEILGEI